MSHNPKPAAFYDYVPWEGGANPAPGRKVHVVFASGSRTEGNRGPLHADTLCWKHKTHLQVNSFEREGKWETENRMGQRHANIVAFRIIQKSDPLPNALARYLDSVKLKEGAGGMPEIE